MTTEPYRAIIVDDEQHCLQTLEYELQRHCPGIAVVATATSGEVALARIAALRPDLLFLDIEMPEMSGFELLERLDMQQGLSVIFVTAFDHYALKAFRYAAVDYLLKPVAGDQLKEAVRRATARGMPSEFGRHLETLLYNLKDGFRSPRIAVPAGRGVDFVDVQDILYCIAESNYTHLYLTGNRKYVMSRTLKDVEHLLPGEDFFRVHQSHLIHFRYLQRYVRDDGGYVIMADGKNIPVGKRRRDELMARIRMH